jgi:phage-related protein
MPNARPIPTIAVAVSELRVKCEDRAFRAFYYTAAPAGVLVFHAFVKKTQQTSPLEIELVRKRLKELRDV